MNEFTKPELAVIHLAIMRDIEQFSHILKTSPSMIALRDKLQKMLDNYCEHDFICTLDGQAFVIVCSKCDKAYCNGMD